MHLLKLLLVVFLLAGNVLSSQAAQASLNIKVVTEILPPYQIRTSDGGVGGFSTQIVKALFEQTGDNAEIKAMPWPRAYGLAKKARNVMIFSLSYSKERDKVFKWVGTLQKEKGYIWGLKSAFNQPFKHLDQARDYRITTTQNSNPHMFLQRQGFTNINKVSSPEQNVLMLFRDRTELVIGAEIPFRYIATLKGYDFGAVRKLLKVKELDTELRLAFGPNSDEQLVRRYQSAFAKLQASGKIDEIRRNWGLSVQP